MSAAGDAGVIEMASAPCADGLASVGQNMFGILSFCGWTQRAAAPALSSTCRASLGFGARLGGEGLEPDAHDGASYWRFLCQCLADERTVYVPDHAACDGSRWDSLSSPAPPAGVAEAWKALFLELYELQRKDAARAKARSEPLTWEHDKPPGGVEYFKIGVAARFKPLASSAPKVEESVTLPIHQKVKLVQKELGCSHSEAMRAIVMQRQSRAEAMGRTGVIATSEIQFLGEKRQPAAASQVDRAGPDGAEQGDAVGDTATNTDPHSKPDEAADGVCSIVSVHEDDAKVLGVTKQSGLREYSFDRVFGEKSTQAQVYELAARKLVMDFLNGSSASMICYGQTGSGKTHTMFGAAPEDVQLSSSDAEVFRGLVPRTCAEVLGAVQHWRDAGLEVSLGASYVELYGSDISDLLKEGQTVGQGVAGRYAHVRATDRVGHRYVLDGHTEVPVNSLEEVEEILRVGDAAKRRAATAMNDRSTRAHAVFVLALSVQRRRDDDDSILVKTFSKSRFYFADLGGSEQIKKSKVDAGTLAPVMIVGGQEQSRIGWQEYYMNRQRIQETLNINRGLDALKRVIEALHKRSRMAADGVPAHLLPYVPYQNSKLTMLLQEALGGASRTLVVTTAALDQQHATESLQTLRFGETCGQIQKREQADQVSRVHVALAMLEKQIADLQAEIAKQERWETRKVERQDIDTIGGEFGQEARTVVRNEVVVQTVLVGAEKEREQMEQLLQRHAALKGLAVHSEQDFRQMIAQDTTKQDDGGKGVDFRQQKRFGTNSKAKDFEDEYVVADALRAFFRKGAGPAAWGETEQTINKRLSREDMFDGYWQMTTRLRDLWEEQIAMGAETRSFGKMMLDRCAGWHKAGTPKDATLRDAAFAELLKELGMEEDVAYKAAWLSTSTSIEKMKELGIEVGVSDSACSTCASSKEETLKPRPRAGLGQDSEEDEF